MINFTRKGHDHEQLHDEDETGFDYSDYMVVVDHLYEDEDDEEQAESDLYGFAELV